MSEEELAQVRERTLVGDQLVSLGFTFSIGAHSIFEEVVGFSPLWFRQGKFFVSIVSHDYCCACYSFR